MPFKLPVRLRKEAVEGYPVGMYGGMEIGARIGSDLGNLGNSVVIWGLWEIQENLGKLAV